VRSQLGLVLSAQSNLDSIFPRETDHGADGVEARVDLVHVAVGDVLKIDAGRPLPATEGVGTHSEIEQPVQIKILALGSLDFVSLAVHPAESTATGK